MITKFPLIESLVAEKRNAIFTNDAPSRPVFRRQSEIALENRIAELTAENARLTQRKEDIASGKVKVDAKVPPVIHRANLKPSTTQIAAAVPVPAIKLTTAADFASPTVTMTRSEFGKLSASDKSRFLGEANHVLIDEPVSALAVLKEQAQAAGVATKPNFEHLKGIERTQAAMAWDAKRKEFFRATAFRQIHDEDMSALRSGPSLAGSGSTALDAAAQKISRDNRIVARAKQLEASIS
ncbi:MAG: hypothetical protein V4689_05930 [Verrucomicrobiota bacterium]